MKQSLELNLATFQHSLYARSIFNLIFLFLKNKMRLRRSPRCLFICVSPLIFSLSVRYASVCLCMPYHFFFFYAVHSISKESRRLFLPRTSCDVMFRSVLMSPKWSPSFTLSDQNRLRISHLCIYVTLPTHLIRLGLVNPTESVWTLRMVALWPEARSNTGIEIRKIL
jgi:hypothetical protein